MKYILLLILTLSALVSCAPKYQAEKELTEEIIDCALTNDWFSTNYFGMYEDIESSVNALQSKNGKNIEKAAQNQYEYEFVTAYSDNGATTVEYRVYDKAENFNFGVSRFVYEENADGKLLLVGLSADYGYPIKNPDEPAISYSAIRYAALPNFLDEEQKELYLRAKTVYPLFVGLDELIWFPLTDGRWNMETDYKSATGEEVGGEYPYYVSATGRYESYADFYAMLRTVFTDEYADELCSGVMIDVDGTTYYPSTSKGGSGAYFPNLYPDTFNLIEKNDDTIEFEVVGHYIFAIHEEDFDYVDDEPYTISTPIRMVKTERGWRFDRFGIAADLFDEDIWNEKYSEYIEYSKNTASIETNYTALEKNAELQELIWENDEISEEEATIIVSHLITLGNDANILSMANFSPTGYYEDLNNEGYFEINRSESAFLREHSEIYSTNDIRTLFYSAFDSETAEDYLAPLLDGIEIEGSKIPLYTDIDGKLFLNAFSPAVCLAYGSWQANTVKIINISSDTIEAEAEIIPFYTNKKIISKLCVKKENNLWRLDDSFGVCFSTINSIDATTPLDSQFKSLLKKLITVDMFDTGDFLFNNCLTFETGDTYALINVNSIYTIDNELGDIFSSTHPINAMKEYVTDLFTEEISNKINSEISQLYREEDDEIFYNLYLTVPSRISRMNLDFGYIIGETDNAVLAVFRYTYSTGKAYTFYRIVPLIKDNGIFKFTAPITPSLAHHMCGWEIIG